MARRFPPSAGVVLVVVVLALLAAGAVVAAGWTDGDDDDDVGGEVQPARTDPAAVEALLDAWRRSRTSTYLLESSFRRTVEGRNGLSSGIVVAQRPPDRVVRQSGSVEARVDGRLVSCATTADDRVECVDRGPAEPYDREVDGVVDKLASYIEGERPVYLVDRVDDECFRLRLALELPEASRQYGDEARLCFDPATGASTRRVITRERSEDVTEAIRLVPAVSERELRLPAAVARRTG